MNIKAFIIFLIVSFFNPSLLLGAGFLIYNQNAAASGMGLSFTAQADNPSAVFYNPAAINRLKGTQLSWGATIIMPQTTFKSYLTGSKTDMESHIYQLPHIFITHKINKEFSLGLGFYSPFGLSVDWPENWEGRYISTFSELRSLFLTPVVSWQLSPKLSIAMGVNLVYSDVEQKKALSFTPLPVKDGVAKLEADGISGGYNLAFLYHFNNILDLGLSYRSKISLTYKGEVETKAPQHLKPYLPHGDISLDIDLPPILVIGIARTFFDRLTVETDFYWIGWSTYDNLYADFERFIPKIFAKYVAPIPRDYHNVFTYSIGMKYLLNPAIILRAGYMYDTSPVPERTCDPILPDADRNEISIGIGYQGQRYNLELTYYAVLVKERRVTNNIYGFNGKYESFVNLISLNFDYRF